MKKIIALLALVFVWQTSFAQTFQLDQYEKFIFNEINLLRSNPKAYVDTLYAYYDMDYCEASIYSKCKYPYNKAFSDAVQQLTKTQPLQQLQYSSHIRRIQKNHKGVSDVFNGYHDMDFIRKHELDECIYFGAFPADCDTSELKLLARKCIISLVLDVGVPSRGHCKSLLNKTNSIGAVRVAHSDKKLDTRSNYYYMDAAVLVNFRKMEFTRMDKVLGLFF